MRTFQAHETVRLHELDGIELADFWQRAVAFAIDAILAIFTALLTLFPFGFAIWAWRAFHGHTEHYTLQLHAESETDKLILEFIGPVLYFGVTTWLGRGRSLGKWLLRIRVVSLVHRHLSLWHSIERALGYAAAMLEFGFGFAQYFIHPYRRTVQDRIAETIVVKERSFQTHQPHAGLADPAEEVPAAEQGAVAE